MRQLSNANLYRAFEYASARTDPDNPNQPSAGEVEMAIRMVLLSIPRDRRPDSIDANDPQSMSAWKDALYDFIFSSG